MNEEELKACPFCGELPTEERDNCACGIFSVIKVSDYNDFIDKWNSAYCWKEIDQLKSALQAKDAEIAELKLRATEEEKNAIFWMNDRDSWIRRFEAERSRSDKLVLALDFYASMSDSDIDCMDYDDIRKVANDAMDSYRKREETRKP